MTQFHQEEQKRFEELLNHYKDSKDYVNAAVNEIRRKPNSVLEQELKYFIKISNLRAMKHILEELLAEIHAGQELLKEELESIKFKGANKHVSLLGSEETLKHVEYIITKKLSDIALEE